MSLSAPDAVRWTQHGLSLFLVALPPLVIVLGPRIEWLRSLPLRLAHATLLAAIGINACFANLSYLSVLEWELRDPSGNSSWFDVPSSDPVAFAAKVLGNTSLVTPLVIAVALLTAASWREAQRAAHVR